MHSFATIPTVLLLLLLSSVTAEISSRQRHRELAKRTSYSSKYTSIVAFGASYQDNAHTRASQYKQYQRPAPYVGGRFTNGPVVVEYLRTNLKAVLFDYAYGGAVVVNDAVASAPVPAVADQVPAYLADVKAGKLKRGKGRSLHVFWAGVNDVVDIWIVWKGNGDKQAAMASLTLHANTLIAAAKKVQSGATTGVSNLDILILPLPPLETTPTLIYQASGNSTQLKAAADFTNFYNSLLASGIKSLTKSGGSKSRVLTYDVQKWWHAAIKTPSKIGVTNVKDTCYNSTTGKVCSKPSEYFYFDSLHLTTTTFKSLARAIQTVI